MPAGKPMASGGVTDQAGGGSVDWAKGRWVAGAVWTGTKLAGGSGVVVSKQEVSYGCRLFAVHAVGR